MLIALTASLGRDHPHTYFCIDLNISTHRVGFVSWVHGHVQHAVGAALGFYFSIRLYYLLWNWQFFGCVKAHALRSICFVWNMLEKDGVAGGIVGCWMFCLAVYM